ncbi:hypothetical protein FC56_GL000513 [Lentilactobacillus senioris DSM 24302 = JCM 17472]|uniref:Uncharacterized protein n=1 Tax=Lentilactobacillus senioris DSM 24302 = JCM 17472 TaxID=1423802 RepID=A0A0R2D2B8_9LACO|nr:hypothetical protein FC56_GL000513 [Lentilactobacillus senioris DSM 24302 = JCM 17472]
MTIIFWSFIFGEIIGYIGSALELMPYSALQVGITAVITAVASVNGIYLLQKGQN